MKKQDLYDLIERRYSESYRKILDNYFAEQEVLAEEYFEQIKDRVEELNKRIQEFARVFGEFDNYSYLGAQAYYGHAHTVHSFAYNSRDYTAYVKNTVKDMFKSTGTLKIAEEYHLIPEAVKYFEFHNKGRTHFMQEKDKLITLKRELNDVVKILPSAKQAVKKLEELGLDLSDLEEVRAEKLPAVVKTSVDICLFNKGGCE